jgi:TatD DNase family protein
MIDTHCHINFENFDKDREELIERSKEKLTAIINSGTNIEGNKESLLLSKENPDFIYPTFGFHPINSGKTSEKDLEIAISYILDHLDDIVAIGEVGMDYFYVKDKDERKKQNEVFKKFAEIANTHKIPILIHARDCERKAYNIVKEYKDIPKVVFHCYSGSLKTVKRILEDNPQKYYFSISTMICYSNHHQELIKDIPLENLLTETDSPYLAPKKGDRNEPINVGKAIQKIAEIKEVAIDYVDEITTNNAKEVFGI